MKILDAAPELLARAPDITLRRYAFAATALGEREMVRVRALAVIAGTKAEATEHRDERQRVSQLAVLNAYAGQPEEARRPRTAPWS